MAGSTLSTTLYAPPTTFYSGASVARNIPAYLPVAIGGHPYLIDLTKYDRQTLDFIRDQADNSEEPGEQSLNPRGLWRRSQEDWTGGAGQVFCDGRDSDRSRYRSSKGIDPWTRGVLSLLPTTEQKLSSASTNLKLLAVGGYMYYVAGQTLKFSADWTPSSPTFTTCTGLPAAAIQGITTNGNTVYAVYTANGIYSSPVGTAAFTSLSAENATVVGYVNGRLLGALGPDIWEYTAAGAKAGAANLFSHPNTSFVWVGFAGGPNAVYAYGNAGSDTAEVYRTANVATSGTLGAPSFATFLPPGETVQSLKFDAGLFILGTNKGLRLGTGDTVGNITVGNYLATGAAVLALETQERYCWYSATNYDSASTGLYRADLGTSTSPLVPAAASDLMATGQGAVTSIASFGGRRYFAVSGLGFYGETLTKVASGTVESGAIRWRTVETKNSVSMNVRHHALGGGASSSAFTFERKAPTVTTATGASVSMEIKADNGDYGSVYSSSVAGSNGPVSPFPTGGLAGETFEIRLTLTRASSDTTHGPEVVSWTIKALPTPERVDRITVPIVLYSTVMWPDDDSGTSIAVDVEAEVAYLRGLMQAGTILRYQEGEQSENCFIYAMEHKPESYTNGFKTFNRTLTVVLQTTEVG